MSKWWTKRMSGLSMPIPNAVVATITSTWSSMKSFWIWSRCFALMTNQLLVHGAEELGGADFAIGADHIEIGSFIALAAATRGEIRIKDVNRDDLRSTEVAFARLGVRLDFEG